MVECDCVLLLNNGKVYVKIVRQIGTNLLRNFCSIADHILLHLYLTLSERVCLQNTAAIFLNLLCLFHARSLSRSETFSFESNGWNGGDTENTWKMGNARVRYQNQTSRFRPMLPTASA